MKFENIPAFNEKNINVIIETPKGSRNKYSYNEECQVMELKSCLPEGHLFPYDFGFVPQTKAEDGDPLDVLVLMDAPAFPGCLVECRILGAITALQKEGGKRIRNDRIVAVPESSKAFNHLRSIRDLNKKILDQVEEFFVSYNKQKGVEFFPLQRIGIAKAILLIKKK